MMRKIVVFALVLACSEPASTPSTANGSSSARAAPASSETHAMPSSTTPSSSAAPVAPTDPLADKGRRFVDLLREKKHADAARWFDTTMAGALPVEKLAGVWTGLETGAGAFQAVESARVEPVGAYRTAIVTCKFANARLDAKIAFDKDEKVAGLFFSPAPEPYADPPYVDRSKFDEREVTVGAGEWALPGTLTLPKGAGPHRAVVLVHGSGPNDRDETVGANRPFKDLAGGLASKGVAVLRYEKRTKLHGAAMAKLPDLTVEQETIEDARAAAGVDAKRIVIAGHSLGGQLAPRIASGQDGIAAIAILAGSTRPVADMMIEQVKYIASLDGRQAPEESAELKALERAAARVREIQSGAPAKDGEMVLGAGPPYWVDMAKYDALAVARDLPRPILVAQGGRDYQVTTRDFEAWKRALTGRKDVTFALYPELNHLFGAGEGKSGPEEYQRRAPVDARLVDDLAKWVGDLP